MIQIVAHRSLSLVIACSDWMQWERRDTSHGWQDKSADRGRAHVVGWARYFMHSAPGPAGAGSRFISIINSASAVGLVCQQRYRDGHPR